ncbi:LysR family transcriptional regulator ArgP [Planctomonas psychrotolerans]|uniref:LysR family transcriptional regulator ArgP n=1 Tax=Planctomonas psychrotolerans TaxID=2528712 RepID=UPI00123A3212|nr:LysR family transcriptional regulator ArgP [Planctomonas psychrotolerans]
MAIFSRDHLETLLVAIDVGTFDAAAVVLGVTPSAVSQRVKAMEQIAGRVLLQRSSPVRPTGDGEVVLRHARQMRLLDTETSRALGLRTGARDGTDAGASGDPVPTPSIPLAVNADSLGTWFLDALHRARRDTDVVFEVHREDQERTATLLRSGVVMAAVTSTRRPVQGCSVVLLGVMRYIPVAAPAFLERYFGGIAVDDRLAALDRVPLVDFDRDDDLQQAFLRDVLGRESRPPRHAIPTSHDFARAILLGFGWGLLPEEQCREHLAAGRLVELAPRRTSDVELWWQRWDLASPLLDRLTDAVRSVATDRLRQPRQHSSR